MKSVIFDSTSIPQICCLSEVLVMRDANLSMSMLAKPSVLFVGAAGLDTLTFLEGYPAEDAKVRAVNQIIDGGGNAANSACSASLLGVTSNLFCAVGEDSASALISEGLKGKDVDTSKVLHKPGKSGTTYVIVCQTTSTRTCIHSPLTTDLTPHDVETTFLDYDTQAWQQYNLIHFDSRHTEAAVAVARKASAAGVLLTIDMEKIRPHVEKLLPYCDVIFTNQHFPATVSPFESDSIQQALNLFVQPWASKCKILINTLGAKGSFILFKQTDVEVITHDHIRPRCCALEDADVWRNLETKITQFADIATETCVLKEEFTVIRTSACRIEKNEVVDTTGSGDAFIGAFLTAFVRGWKLENCARLGTLVAREKIKQHGARQGLPTLQQVLDLFA